jgi:hypothetical protein
MAERCRRAAVRIPVIRGLIDRRILVNYRVDPAVLARALPPPFRPKIVRGVGMAGICLIRLRQVRPRLLPPWLGIASENAALRIAVEWDERGARHEGVFIPRRDTSSRLNALAGGRLFPGAHHHARFQVWEHGGRYHVALDSDDGRTHLLVEGIAASDLPASSVFGSLSEASEFFRRGSLGYSATMQPGLFDGLELRTFDWQVAPLSVGIVESSFFENERVFPKGSAQLDCALLMREVEHEWHSREPLSTAAIHDGAAHANP